MLVRGGGEESLERFICLRGKESYRDKSLFTLPSSDQAVPILQFRAYSSLSDLSGFLRVYGQRSTALYFVISSCCLFTLGNADLLDVFVNILY